MDKLLTYIKKYGYVNNDNPLWKKQCEMFEALNGRGKLTNLEWCDRYEHLLPKTDRYQELLDMASGDLYESDSVSYSEEETYEKIEIPNYQHTIDRLCKSHHKIVMQYDNYCLIDRGPIMIGVLVDPLPNYPYDEIRKAKITKSHGKPLLLVRCNAETDVVGYIRSLNTQVIKYNSTVKLYYGHKIVRGLDL
jgi:hypothetical protein